MAELGSGWVLSSSGLVESTGSFGSTAKTTASLMDEELAAGVVLGFGWNGDEIVHGCTAAWWILEHYGDAVLGEWGSCTKVMSREIERRRRRRKRGKKTIGDGGAGFGDWVEEIELRMVVVRL
ncbi:hypothetical protein M0R45_008912 [Rubus argutus]|uniref:Uncharacterized protein n=1 Tax=Rubus argutus TaxID=59490 RepID=A0AAW1Y310_RUBAR